MRQHLLDLETADGAMDTYIAAPDDDVSRPAILFFMDGLGPRPVLHDMARRLAAHGYRVLLPNLYHRGGRADGFDLVNDHDRMYALFASITPDTLAMDIDALCDHLDQQQPRRARRIGCVGYCLGGRVALTAAARHPERVVAAASIHGAQLAVEELPNSPHHNAAAMRGKIYVAVAEEDPWLTPGETERLDAALAGAQRDYEIELYPGVAHGFAVPGLPVFNEAAAQRHWDRILRLFETTLKDNC